MPHVFTAQPGQIDESQAEHDLSHCFLYAIGRILTRKIIAKEQVLNKGTNVSG